ncbi:MAG TPA: [FeFe] hydrogenase H-cluster maturation GTPase HydF [Tenuifilaceae bacterium]|nr:[FeFe] hydrogenase H-cluster maturation GTPase HydF [Tenuifilaceae bacterium]HPQ35553.1 [FeFe] hydrogenase H-cluster maturation GTPase HydF [Tenuifilaceae bacterium]HRX67350.1 [FeFe] hydrogenase H-cluster maturation GTPase HydF [Tenuifilaceae bacterium]
MSKGKESKPHIGIYGRRNNGKSSLINMLAGQDVAIVSDYAGTTTDPVKKSFEITGFGPVILIDTAGIDDVGELGNLRIEKTLGTIKQIDLAILVLANNVLGTFETMLVDEFRKNETPFVVVHSKQDIAPIAKFFKDDILKNLGNPRVIEVSATQRNGLEDLVNAIRVSIPESSYKTPTLLGDLVKYGDIVLLITPIDVEAPVGRLILPQVQTIRDALDNDAVAIVLKEREVDAFLRKTGIRPALAVTDSQIFTKADASIPRDIPLTSFSILLARLKGDFDSYIKGTPKISELKDGERVLILESCTHHVSCDDISRVKIPRWISNFTGKRLEYEVVSGLDKLPRPITDYSIVIQCGGCVITRKQIFSRLKPAIDAGIPVTNFGMAIAYVQGIFNRAVEPFVLGRKVTGSEYL